MNKNKDLMLHFQVQMMTSINHILYSIPRQNITLTTGIEAESRSTTLTNHSALPMAHLTFPHDKSSSQFDLECMSKLHYVMIL